MITFSLNNKNIDPPLGVITNVGDSGGLFINASFGNDRVQPEIEPIEFRFGGTGAQELKDLIKNGNRYRKTEYNIKINQNTNFKANLNLSKDYREVSNVEVVAKAEFEKSLLTLEEELSIVNFDTLIEEGDLSLSDFHDFGRVVQLEFEPVKLAAISISAFLLIVQALENIEKISQDINIVIGLTGTSATGAVGATIYQIAVALTRVAYQIAVTKAIIELLNDILLYFISPVLPAYGISYLKVLQAGFNNLGYGFETDIPELTNLHYFAPFPNENGVPKSNDYGYIFGDFVSLVRRKFQIDIGIQDNVVQFRSEGSQYWRKESTYRMPDILFDGVIDKKTNSEDLIARRIFEYQLDPNDSNTIDNYQGTQYSVIVRDSDGAPNNLKGYEKRVFPVSLATRKDDLNATEKALKVLATIADNLLSVFGSNKNFVKKIEKRVGMIVTSGETTTVPKVVYADGGNIPKNHRDFVSAKYLYDNYLNVLSFVLNNFSRQRVVYESVEIPLFGSKNYEETINNSYFFTSSGKKGKFVESKYDVFRDTLISTFWIEELDTTKLIETYNERLQ